MPDHTTATSAGNERVDHGRDRIGGVMEAVDEFETERDQQGDEQQNEWRVAGHARAGRVEIGVDAVGHKQQSASEDSHQDDGCERMRPGVQIGALASGRLDQAGQCNVGHVVLRSPKQPNLRNPKSAQSM
jgi:hypothetical protein